jgi:hypothetical protein
MMSPFGGRQVGAPSPKERYSGLHLKRSRHRFQRYLLRKQNVANREIAPRPETPRRQLAARKDQADIHGRATGDTVARACVAADDIKRARRGPLSVLLCRCDQCNTAGAK